MEKSVKIGFQKQFPYYKEFKAKFPITKDTIFIYKDTIYTDNELPYDILAHEGCHLKQQEKHGADEWIRKYLDDPQFRLDQEIQAYRVQLRLVKSTGDQQEYGNILMECARNLSSELYENLVSYTEAIKILKI